MPVLHNQKGCFTSQFLTKRLPEIFQVAFSPQTPYPSKVQAAFSRKNTQSHEMTENNTFVALSGLRLFVVWETGTAHPLPGFRLPETNHAFPARLPETAASSSSTRGFCQIIPAEAVGGQQCGIHVGRLHVAGHIAHGVAFGAGGFGHLAHFGFNAFGYADLCQRHR